MRFGFHVSIAGGLSRSIEEARRLKCETIQIFSRNPQGWQLKQLDTQEVERFRQGVKGLALSPVIIHLPYLPNLASEDEGLYQKSITALVLDIVRAVQLGVQYVVTHMGRPRQASAAEAVRRMIHGINQAWNEAENHLGSKAIFGPASPRLLLENTAGMGKGFGGRFEHLQAVIAGVDAPGRLGVVLDTAHMFEAGYDIRTQQGLDQALRDFDIRVGLQRLRLLHLSDSKTGLGSHVDRHWHIGRGEIGLEGFRRIVNHPLLAHLPAILETPKTGPRADADNMRTVRSLVRDKDSR